MTPLATFAKLTTRRFNLFFLNQKYVWHFAPVILLMAEGMGRTWNFFLYEQSKLYNSDMTLDITEQDIRTPKGINYIDPLNRTKLNEAFVMGAASIERYRNEIQIIKEDLGCNALRVAGGNINKAIEIGKTSLEMGITPWMSPRFCGNTFEATKNHLRDYVECCVANGLEYCPLIVANELLFDCTDIIRTNTTSTKERHEEIHEMLKKGERPDVTEKVIELIQIARQLGWKGPLTYAAFAYETVKWEMIGDENLIIAANLYWERDLETEQAKTRDHYEGKIRKLESQAGTRRVVITEFGVTPHQNTLAYGGGSFKLRGSVDYSAQAEALDQYLSVIQNHPKVGYFLYSFEEEQNPFREGNFGVVNIKRSILRTPEYTLTEAAKKFSTFNKTRSSDEHGIEVNTD